MTYLARLMILAALSAGPSVGLADGYIGTVTGPKGGTSTFTGGCAVGETSVTCTRDSVVTGPKGYSATRRVDRESTADGVTKKIMTTGQYGRTVTTTREWKR